MTISTRKLYPDSPDYEGMCRSCSARDPSIVYQIDIGDDAYSLRIYLCVDCMAAHMIDVLMLSLKERV